MNHRFDLLIFDWDGTLVDSIDWIVHCVTVAANKSALKLPSVVAIKAIIGLSIQQAMRTLFPEVDSAALQQLVTDYSNEFSTKPITRADLFDGVYPMLLDFKRRGYQLAVATGKTRAGLNRALLGTGTADLFVITRCADETASKPNPLMINQIIDFTQVSQARTLLIGDSLHDLQMAHHADIAAVAVACGAHSAELLKAQKPLRCLSQTIELYTFIDGLN
jgi:phosphoglycolate phosphatase